MRPIPRGFRVPSGRGGGAPLRHLSVRVLSRVWHSLPFSHAKLLADIYTGFGHRSCDYLPSPLIGTIYVPRGSCISRLALVASHRLFACRNFRRFVRIGVSLSRRKIAATCCRTSAGGLAGSRAISFDVVSFGSSTTAVESRLAFLNERLSARYKQLRKSVPRSLMETTCSRYEVVIDANR